LCQFGYNKDYIKHVLCYVTNLTVDHHMQIARRTARIPRAENCVSEL